MAIFKRKGRQRATTKQVYVLVRGEFEPEIPLIAHKSGALTDSDTLPRLRARIVWYTSISEWYAPTKILASGTSLTYRALDQIYLARLMQIVLIRTRAH